MSSSDRAQALTEVRDILVPRLRAAAERLRTAASAPVAGDEYTGAVRGLAEVMRREAGRIDQWVDGLVDHAAVAGAENREDFSR